MYICIPMHMYMCMFSRMRQSCSRIRARSRAVFRVVGSGVKSGPSNRQGDRSPQPSVNFGAPRPKPPSIAFVFAIWARGDMGGEADRCPAHHANPYVGVSRPRSWSHLPVLGAISWACIAKY